MWYQLATIVSCYCCCYCCCFVEFSFLLFLGLLYMHCAFLCFHVLCAMCPCCLAAVLFVPCSCFNILCTLMFSSPLLMYSIAYLPCCLSSCCSLDQLAVEWMYDITIRWLYGNWHLNCCLLCESTRLNSCQSVLWWCVPQHSFCWVHTP